MRRSLVCGAATIMVYAGFVCGIVPDAAAQNSDITTQRVQFKSDASSATVKGTIQGYQTRDYVLGARAGQTMSVKMASKNGFLYFNVLKDKDQPALFVGSGEAKPNEWSGKLPASGDYIIRVYLIRAEARRGGRGDFQFTVSIATSSP